MAANRRARLTPLRLSCLFGPISTARMSRWPSNATTRAMQSPAGRSSGTSVGYSTPTKMIRARNIMFLKCSHTRPGAFIWVTSATTPWATWSPAICGRAATMCSTRWAGTPSDCRRRTPQSSAASTPPNGPTTISPPCAGSSKAWGCRSTGRASSRPATSTITINSKGYFWICSQPASSTASSGR